MDEKKRDVWFLILLVAISGFVFFSLGVTAAWKWGFPQGSVRIEYPVYYAEEATTTTVSKIDKVNLNTATVDELMQIEGIGEKTAQNIVEYREKIGGYTFMEQLLDVDGIGEKKLDTWKAYLFLADTVTTVVSTTVSGTPTVTSTTVFSGVLHLNTATKEELILIDGIGEKTAEKIIAYRDAIGGFTSLEQLMEIEGIGEKKFALWSRYLTLEE